LKVAKIEQRAEVERLSATLVAANVALTESEQAESRLERAQRKTASAVATSTTAVERNADAVRTAADAAKALGVDIEDVAAAQAKLTRDLNGAGRSAQEFAANI
jgi:transcription initiation factor TFIIIB Brf1 subunit/transcription initiation factor TFIIB